VMPSLDKCSHCGGDVVPQGGRVSFGLSSGGVLCQNCRPGQRHVVSLPPGDLEAVHILASPGGAWRELDFRCGRLTAARETIAAVVSHALGHHSRLRPLLGV
jgi:DNA repair protein RecO (recombination protein O)